jgi:hypothetical protein
MQSLRLPAFEAVPQCHCEGVRFAATEAISQGSENNEIAALPRIESGVARNDRAGIATQSLRTGG